MSERMWISEQIEQARTERDQARLDLAAKDAEIEALAERLYAEVQTHVAVGNEFPNGDDTGFLAASNDDRWRAKLAAKEAEIAAMRAILLKTRRYVHEDSGVSRLAKAHLAEIDAALEMSGGVL